MSMTWRRRRPKFCKKKCRDIDTNSSFELFNHIFDCYNTWAGCLQLELGRKFPLSRNRAVIARMVGLDDRYTLRKAVFRHFRRKMNNNHNSAHAQKKSLPALNLTAKFELNLANGSKVIKFSGFLRWERNYPCIEAWPMLAFLP
ncbi:hypothetical protein AVEN_68422-1 [Araneus ventricosus]|uniref:Uncharacterized protein n=1 Tax=Araneus ventricosus TaxID=182803 RepID=A0A4Y2I153_ARAVE|nr:hypothetical protein AVEN_68422-1 [Araneus ventricosus]